MNTTVRTFLRHAVIFVAAFTLPAVRAERAPQSPDELKKNATNIVIGKVTVIKSESVTQKGYKRTDYVAQVRIEKSEKGELKAGEMISVSYWTQRWVGLGLPPPGPSGCFDIPKEGETLRIYVARKAEAAGATFRLLEPNGFSREGVETAK